MITKFIRKLLGRGDEAPASPVATDAPSALPSADDARSPRAHADDLPSKAGELSSAAPATASGERPRRASGARDRDPAGRRRGPKVAAARPSAPPVHAAAHAIDATSAAVTANGGAEDPDPEAPVVIAADQHGIDPALISRNAVRVTQGLQEAGYRAFIVGGAVRDLLFGVAPKDFDVATDATPDQVQRLFRRARIIGRRFQIVHVQFGQEIIEVSTFRALVDPAAPGIDPAAPPAAEADGNGNAERDGLAARDAENPLDAEDAGEADDVTDLSEDERLAADDARATADIGELSRQVRLSVPERGRRRRREDPDRRLHAVDASGRVLRDNVWGQQHEDARRRDFTINAMYYDPATQTVLDYHGGMADVRARLLRMIGDPTARYREDPVRMLRVVRFAAKLGFDIEPATRAPIATLAGLLNNVPAARVFDEILKLLLSGHALACVTRLKAEGLNRDLLPLLDAALDQPDSEKFITLALSNTDTRIRAGKPVSPGFLFAALLWHQTQQRWQEYVAAGEFQIPALHRAMDEVLDAQTGKLAIQRRFVADMKEIWGMQPRLEKHSGRSALKLLEHPRFRAAYDFLLLRCESGELDTELGQWWTDFMAGDPGAREALLNGSAREARPRPRRRRRSGARPAGSGDTAAERTSNASDAPSTGRSGSTGDEA